MSTLYLLDLRAKIVTVLKNRSLQRNVVKRFKVLLSTIKRYWKLHKEKADLHPKKTTFCSILSENYTNLEVFYLNWACFSASFGTNYGCDYG